MGHDMGTPDIGVYLNSDSFDPSDSQDVGERLRSESELRIESEVAAYAHVEGWVPPPDVAINILYSLVPLADI
jgi:hypothetical protein